ncbi:MAG: hypothetical protein JXB19_02400 [Bacteroidales bacterium]|nr:hypothetical protein [Bacteroidales bacterium]
MHSAQTSADLHDPAFYNAVILNEYPVLVNDSERYHIDLQLDTLSPVKDAGNPDIISTFTFLEIDLNGNLRTVDAGPDPGAFEGEKNNMFLSG